MGRKKVDGFWGFVADGEDGSGEEDETEGDAEYGQPATGGEGVVKPFGTDTEGGRKDRCGVFALVEDGFVEDVVQFVVVSTDDKFLAIA